MRLCDAWGRARRGPAAGQALKLRPWSASREREDSTPDDSAGRWLPVTASASSPGVTTAAAMPTTCGTGPTAARRHSTISCCCAGAITARCTRRASVSRLPRRTAGRRVGRRPAVAAGDGDRFLNNPTEHYSEGRLFRSFGRAIRSRPGGHDAIAARQQAPDLRRQRDFGFHPLRNRATASLTPQYLSSGRDTLLFDGHPRGCEGTDRRR